MRNEQHDAPRLVPTGNVDEVLLTGKSHGKNLTLFQSAALMVVGVCFALVGVVSVGLFGFGGESLYLQLFACAISLSGDL